MDDPVCDGCGKARNLPKWITDTVKEKVQQPPPRPFILTVSLLMGVFHKACALWRQSEYTLEASWPEGETAPSRNTIYFMRLGWHEDLIMTQLVLTAVPLFTKTQIHLTWWRETVWVLSGLQHLQSAQRGVAQDTSALMWVKQKKRWRSLKMAWCCINRGSPQSDSRPFQVFPRHTFKLFHQLTSVANNSSVSQMHCATDPV